MAILSVFNLIRAMSLFHIGCAYVLLVNPGSFADQNMVVVLGEAMQMPATKDFSQKSEATAYAALVLFFLGASDLLAASLPEITSLEYWISQVPVRLLLLFGLTTYTYLFKEDGMLGAANSALKSAAGQRTTGELLRNNLVFTTGFIEVSLWFWVFVLLRDERRALAVKLAERRHEREELYGKSL